MTNNVDSLPIKNKRARLQFTILELLLFATMTFLGMALLEPQINPETKLPGCIAVVIATAVGALMGSVRSRTDSSGRIFWLVGGVVFGWLLAGWLTITLQAGLHRNLNYSIVLILLGSPLAIPFLMMFLRGPREDGKCPFPSPLLTMVFAFAYVAAVILIAPLFLYTRCGGSTETAAAAACKAYAEAQEIYHRTDYSGTGLQYAINLQTLFGNKGELALIDKNFAQAEIGHPAMQPKAGYYFKVLAAQGPSATGGRRSYLDANGKMTLGYALIAIPSTYDQTGRDCFIISHNGTIFERDLGPNTPFIAAAMAEFDPDTNWVPTQ